MGRAVRIALIVGLHRARDDESIEEQIRRRTFWSLYLLDRQGPLFDLVDVV